jgi:putative transposase
MLSHSQQWDQVADTLNESFPKVGASMMRDAKECARVPGLPERPLAEDLVK